MSTGGQRGCMSAPGSGGKPGLLLEEHFQGIEEEEEEMLLFFSPSPGSLSSSISLSPQPLWGEEVVALGTRCSCQQPASMQCPHSMLQ